jgi:hypothetical protein
MEFLLPHSFQSQIKIDHRDQLLLVGSCFAEEIGKLLKQDLFHVTINPHGILFNPHSVAQSILQALTPNNNHLLYEHNHSHYAMQWHGKFNHRHLSILNAELRDANNSAKQALNNATTIIVTWGSAWVYELKKTTQIVGNCHKLPGNLFNKRMLTVAEIAATWQPIIAQLQSLGKQAVFTISPVRYIKDGLHENMLSKATLFLALQTLRQAFPNVHYFPAYELVTDILRDYRFYKEDMLHPTEQAVKFVYEHLQQITFTDTTQQLLPAIRTWAGMRLHKPITRDEQLIAQFESKIEEKKQALLNTAPYLLDRMQAIFLK